MKRCPHCDTMNHDDAQACYVCHTSLVPTQMQFSASFRDPSQTSAQGTITCPSCGTANAANAAVCRNCQRSLQAMQSDLDNYAQRREEQRRVQQEEVMKQRFMQEMAQPTGYSAGYPQPSVPAAAPPPTVPTRTTAAPPTRVSEPAAPTAPTSGATYSAVSAAPPEKRFFNPVRLLAVAGILSSVRLVLYFIGASPVWTVFRVITYVALWLLSRVAINGIPKVKRNTRLICEFIWYIAYIASSVFDSFEDETTALPGLASMIIWFAVFWTRYLVYAKVYDPNLEAGPRNPFLTLSDRDPSQKGASKGFKIAMAIIGGFIGLLVLLCVIAAVLDF